MDFDLINKKLSQAQICLSEMYAQERRAFDSTNSFERHHDGFLSACATVRGLFHERGGGPRDKAIKDWKSAWVKNLTGKRQRFMTTCKMTAMRRSTQADLCAL